MLHLRFLPLFLCLQLRELRMEVEDLQSSRVQDDVISRAESRVKELENSLRAEERSVPWFFRLGVGVHLGKIASLSQGSHIVTNSTQILRFTPKGNLESPVNWVCVFLNYLLWYHNTFIYYCLIQFISLYMHYYVNNNQWQWNCHILPLYVPAIAEEHIKNSHSCLAAAIIMSDRLRLTCIHSRGQKAAK